MNPFKIDATKPVEAISTVGFWMIFGVPASVALIWGVYDPNNFSSVLGIAGRRAGGAAIQETRPIGEALYNGTSGKGLRPGDASQTGMEYNIRPGAIPTSDQYSSPTR